MPVGVDLKIRRAVMLSTCRGSHGNPILLTALQRVCRLNTVEGRILRSVNDVPQRLSWAGCKPHLKRGTTWVFLRYDNCDDDEWLRVLVVKYVGEVEHDFA